MIFREQPTDPWEDFDFLLLEAFQAMQDEQCPKCGNPVYLCRSTSNLFRWKIKSDVCQAERALKEHANSQLPSKDQEKDKRVKREWGLVEWAIPEMWDKNMAMPSRRELLSAVD